MEWKDKSRKKLLEIFSFLRVWHSICSRVSKRENKNTVALLLFGAIVIPLPPTTSF
jgi:hypothetical protein